MKEKTIKFYIFPAIIAIVFLLLTFFDWAYGFYSLLRTVITIVAIYYAYYLYQELKRKDFWFWALIIIVVLFNPIIPVYLYDKTVWGVIDVVVAIFFLVLIIKFRKK